MSTSYHWHPRHVITQNSMKAAQVVEGRCTVMAVVLHGASVTFVYVAESASLHARCVALLLLVGIHSSVQSVFTSTCTNSRTATSTPTSNMTTMTTARRLAMILALDAVTTSTSSTPDASSNSPAPHKPSHKTVITENKSPSQTTWVFHDPSHTGRPCKTDHEYVTLNIQINGTSLKTLIFKVLNILRLKCS